MSQRHRGPSGFEVKPTHTCHRGSLSVSHRLNWLNGERLGGGSFDAATGSIMDMLDFTQKPARKLVLDPTFGTVDSKTN